MSERPKRTYVITLSEQFNHPSYTLEEPNISAKVVLDYEADPIEYIDMIYREVIRNFNNRRK